MCSKARVVASGFFSDDSRSGTEVTGISPVATRKLVVSLEKLSVRSSLLADAGISAGVVSHESAESSSVVTSSGSRIVVVGGGSAVGTSWHSGPSLTSSTATPTSPGF